MELRLLKRNHEHEAVYFYVKSAFQLFDGNRGHWVEPFEGERISFVFFTVGKYWKTNPDVLADLRDCGFEIPTSQTMAHAESLLPRPRGYGAKRLPKMASLPDMFGKTHPRPQVVKRAWEVPREASPKKDKGEHNVLDWLRCRSPCAAASAPTRLRQPPPIQRADRRNAPKGAQKTSRGKVHGPRTFSE